ncbi:hypothetical protein COK03_29720 [Priestia megaterium]|nr:hypothetical protein COK03_29720 [Priestia megaterium]
MTGLFITAAFLASPVFAAEDLCAINLQKIKDEQTISTPVDPAKGSDYQADIDKAKHAQMSGDKKSCIELTTKTLSDIEKSKKGGAAGK